MAATNSTANLELSQFVGTDKPDWLTDYNGDMLKIDTAYGAVSALAEEAAANAESAAASAAQASTDAAAAVADVAGAVSAAQAATAAATEATQTAASAISTATAAQSVANAAAGDATSALSVAQNAKTTAESAQAAAAQAATDAASAATDAAASAAIASGVDNRVTAIEDCVPASASGSNKFATMADVGGGSTSITIDIPANTTYAALLQSIYNEIETADLWNRIYEKGAQLTIDPIASNYTVGVYRLCQYTKQKRLYFKNEYVASYIDAGYLFVVINNSNMAIQDSGNGYNTNVSSNAVLSTGTGKAILTIY